MMISFCKKALNKLLNKKNWSTFINKLFDNNVLVPLIICFGSIILSLIFHPYYEQNDDVAMKQIASGTLAAFNSPNEHLVFMNIIYGYILKFLYTLFNNVDWYDISYFLNTIISTLVCSYSLLRLSDDFRKKVFAALTVLVIFPIFFICYQFSIFASLYSFSGIFLIYTLFIKPHDDKVVNIFSFVLAIYLFVLGTLIRIESAILILGLCTCLTFCMLIYFKKKIKQIFLFLLISALCLFSCVVLYNFNNKMYSNSEWKDYYKINLGNVKLIQYNDFSNVDIYNHFKKEYAEQNINIDEQKFENIKKILLEKKYSSEQDIVNKIFAEYSYGNLTSKDCIAAFTDKNYLNKILQKSIDKEPKDEILKQYYNEMQKDKFRSVLKEFDMTENDYNLLQDLFNYNTEKYSKETLNSLYDKLNTEEYKKAKARTSFKKIKNSLNDYEGKKIINLYIVLFCLMLLTSKNKKYFTINLVSILIFTLFEILILFVFKIAPYRVFFPMFIACLLYMMSIDYNIKSYKKMLFQIIVVFVLVLIPQINYSIERNIEGKKYAEYENIMKESLKDHTVFIVGASYLYELTNKPFKRIPEYYKSENFVGFGWLSYTPNFQSFYIKKFGTNEFTKFIFSEKALVLTYNPNIQHIIKYSAEKYNKQATYVKITDFPHYRVLVKIKQER